MDLPVTEDTVVGDGNANEPEVYKSASEILRTQGLLETQENKLDSKEEADKLLWEKNLAQEQAEWDALDLLKNPVSGVVRAIEDISFSEALQHFQNQSFDFPSLTSKIQRSKFSQVVRLLFGPRPLVRSLRKERDLVFNIVQVTIDNDKDVHCRVLQTIYKRLTGSKHNCPRFGAHWEVIGFQGNDPATDLRGAGFLALLHLLFLVTNNRSIAVEMYKLSTHPEQNFPFCLVSINVTRITIQALREDKLSNICNKRKQVVSVMNDYYLAVFWHIYQIWKTQHKTMNDSGHVLKAAEQTALKNPSLLLKNMQLSISKRHQHSLIPPPVVAQRLSTASSISDTSLQSPAITSHSLDVVLQPIARERSESKASDPRFAGIYELSKETADEPAKSDMTSHI